VFARFCPADDKFSAEKLFVVKFRDRALGFFNCVHLHKGEAFRALVMFVADNLCVLNLPDAVKEVEQIAFRGIERKISDVETRRSDFDVFWFMRYPRRLFALRVRTIPRRWFSCILSVAEKGDDL
jgi:hypothetical protein